MKPKPVPWPLHPATTPSPTSAGLAPPGQAAPPGGDEPPATRGPWRLIVFVFVAPLVAVLLLEHYDVPRLLSNWIQKLLG